MILSALWYMLCISNFLYSFVCRIFIERWSYDSLYVLFKPSLSLFLQNICSYYGLRMLNNNLFKRGLRLQGVHLSVLKFLWIFVRSSLWRKWRGMCGGEAKLEETKLSVCNPSSSLLKLCCGVLRPSRPLRLYFEAMLYYKVCSGVRWIVYAKSKYGGRLNIFHKYLIFRVADINKNNIFHNIIHFFRYM